MEVVDRGRAAELALQEVLESVKAAMYAVPWDSFFSVRGHAYALPSV